MASGHLETIGLVSFACDAKGEAYSYNKIGIKCIIRPDSVQNLFNAGSWRRNPLGLPKTQPAYSQNSVEDISERKRPWEEKEKDRKNMKREIKICLKQVEDIRRFVEEAEQLARDVDVCSTDGLRRVSGRSLIGMFSLDLSVPVEAVYNGENEEDERKFLFLARKYREEKEKKESTSEQRGKP